MAPRYEERKGCYLPFAAALQRGIVPQSRI